MSPIKLTNIEKVYDNGFHAVHDFNLEIQDNEFIVFVGPSGCGKSTTLRMIAGLEDITAGSLVINGKEVNHLPPKDRGISMVFQSYALYPTMSVYDNMAFGLKLRDVDVAEIDERVKNAAEILGLTEYLDNKPRELSGGQRQRVALGRSIVREAPVYLMDEPLSNLDAKLRVEMRSQIKDIHERTGATTIYVTHDQVEAMTMADRIVVMKLGVIQQIGTPEELYKVPANIFVAGFLGDPPMNFIKGMFDGEYFVLANGIETKIKLPGNCNETLKDYVNKEVILGVRPEDLTLDTHGEESIDCEIVATELLGDVLNIYTDIGSQRIICKCNEMHRRGQLGTINFGFKAENVHLFDAETEKRIG